MKIIERNYYGHENEVTLEQAISGSIDNNHEDRIDRLSADLKDLVEMVSTLVVIIDSRLHLKAKEIDDLLSFKYRVEE